MKARISIRYLVLAANAFILLIPVFAFVFFHLWEGHLVRLAEQQLIAESVLIREAWREHLGRTESEEVIVSPVEPILELDYELEDPVPSPARFVPPGDGPEWRAGQKIADILARSHRANRSEVRVLDANGCVVATTGGDLGACLDTLPEVHTALSGRYAASARAEPAEDPSWPAGQGHVRVHTALPVSAGDQVVGVVLSARASSSPLEVFWRLRYTVLVAALLCLAVTAMVSLFLSRVISWPVQKLTGSAEAIVRGEPPRPFSPGGIAPAEVAALAEALERMTQQLTDRAEYISRFATNVSHELKTPLAAIRGAVELLREDWSAMSAEQRQRFLDNVAGDTERMDRLVTRLLQLARIQSSPETAAPVAVAPFFEGLLERYDGSVLLRMTEAPREVLINPDHLETAVRNLVDNAVRHSAGQPVEITLRAAGERLVVDVCDRGAGISEGNRSRVFERFFTTERDRGGTGLGLSIVRAVAETRGGEVSFITGPSGTTFTLVV